MKQLFNPFSTIPRLSLEVKRSQGVFSGEFYVKDLKTGHLIVETLHALRPQARIYKGFTLCPLTARVGGSMMGKRRGETAMR